MQIIRPPQLGECLTGAARDLSCRLSESLPKDWLNNKTDSASEYYPSIRVYYILDIARESLWVIGRVHVSP